MKLGHSNDAARRHDALGGLLTALILALALAIFPSTAFAADGDVAQIGDTTYATLDEAVTAAKAESGDTTITILEDCNISSLTISDYNKTFVFEGATGDETITFTVKGIALHGNLTFKNCNVVMNQVVSPSSDWQTILMGNSTLTLDNATLSMDGTGLTNSLQVHGIYCWGSDTLNIINGSTLNITNYQGDALEWDGEGSYVVNITDSKYTSDANRSGFTGTFTATIANSTVKVINSTGNGSNGSNFYITDSDVDFSNNGSHGLSAADLVVSNSTITANGNGANGIHVTGVLDFDESTITIQDNACSISSQWTIPGALYFSGTNGTIDNTVLTITGNSGSGIYQKGSGTLTIANTCATTIMNNTASKLSYGGGVYVNGTVNLADNVVLYNNHAGTAGDDIYVVEGGSITFPVVGSNWYLDGDPDCEHKIDGWYDDSVAVTAVADDDVETTTGGRWNVLFKNALCSTTSSTEHIDLYKVTGTSATATGAVALKAAHGRLITVNYQLVSTYNPSDATLPDEDIISLGSEYTAQGASTTAESGWVFYGWYADAACTTLYENGTELTEDTILYGKWVKTYNVTYEWVGDEYPTDVNVPEGETVESGFTYTVKPQDLSDGWTFDGWYLDSDCTIPAGDSLTITGDVTLYGKWVKATTTTTVTTTTTTTTTTTSGTGTSTVSATPATGDTTNVAAVAGIAIAGIAIVAVAIVLRRRSKQA